MRLICPNCDARYAVPDEVMPVEGRDVQCSSCGQTWFQHHPNFPPAPEPVLEPAPQDAQDVAPAQRPARPEPKRRDLDPAVADILKQEAQAEIDARRRAEAATIETQPELGLETTDAPQPQQDATEVAQRADEAKRRMARMRGEAVPAAGGGSRRGLLPDIEEINSTLRSGSAVPAAMTAAPDAQTAQQRASSGRGFILTVALFAVLALLYVFAPQIAQTVPALDQAMVGYVNTVDNMRRALDGQLAALLAWLENTANQSGA